MKSILAGVAIALSFAAFPVNRGLVTDDAHVFTQEEEAQLEAKLRTFAQARGVELAVVTVTSLDGMSIDEYRVALFKQWGIGKKDTDNGVLMVIAPNEPPRGKVGIEVGYGLEGLLNDGAVGAIIRESIVPGWRSAHRASGLIAGVDAIISRLSAAPPEAATTAPPTAQDVGASAFAWAVVLIVLSSLVAFVVALLSKRRRGQEADRARERLSLLYRSPSPAYAPKPYLQNPYDTVPARRSEGSNVPPASSAGYVLHTAAPSSTPSYESPRDYSSISDSGISSSSFDFGGGSSGGGGSSSDL